MNRIFIASVLAAVFVGGCRNNSDNTAFTGTQSLVAERSGDRPEWDGHTITDTAVRDAVKRLLAGPLNTDTAVQIALLNNRHLQADLENLGIAQADLVQAGLLKNPVFTLGVRFPDRAPSETYLDFAVASDFLDVIFIPARKKLAGQHLAQAQATLADEALTMVSQSRREFYEYQSAVQSEKLLAAEAEAATASLKTAETLHQAGNINDLEMAKQRAQALRAQIELADAEAEVNEAREKVTEQLGLWGDQINWRATETLPPIPIREIALENLPARAQRQREDLAALRLDVLVKARTLGLTADYRFFQDVELGPEFERETDGQWRIGPSLSIPIPLFDQGQAKISRAKAVLRQSEQRYVAKAIDVQSEVRAATANLQSARQKALLYRDQLLPVQRELFRQTQLQYNGMYLGVFQLLEARREQMETEEKSVEATRDYWVARAELERAVGGRLGGGMNDEEAMPMNGNQTKRK